MPKGNKSSASAATRKKHAKKGAKGQNEDGGAKPAGGQGGAGQKKSKKLTKAEKKAPKVKQYVPPPKPPTPAIPDPLDSQGLAHTLPPELVVSLRRLAKKDPVTKRKGLEELYEQWVVPVRATSSGDEDQDLEREIKEASLSSSIPVWLHNLAQLLQSPTHRSFALQIHQELLSIVSTRRQILDALSLSLLPGDQNRDTLGSWLVAAVEERRKAGGSSLACWNSSTSFQPTEDRIDLTPHLDELVSYLSSSILDSAALNDSIYPSTGSSSNTLEPEEEAWYRVGGLIGLTFLVEHLGILSEGIMTLIGRLWSSLSSVVSCLGSGQPTVRRAAYGLLHSIVDKHPDLPEENLPSDLVTFCWKETEGTVWEVSGPVIAKLLKRYPHWWLVDTDQDEEDGSEDGSDESGRSIPDDFLQFIATICPSIPQVTYPLLLVAVSTMPRELLVLDPDISSPLSSFFSHLWSAVDARLLSTYTLPNQPSSFQVFLQSALDCIVLLSSRAIKEDEPADVVDFLINEQLIRRAWDQCVLTYGGRSTRGAKVPPETEAAMFAQAIARMATFSPDTASAVLSKSLSTLVSRCFDSEGDSRLPSRVVPILETMLSTLPDFDKIIQEGFEMLTVRCLDGVSTINNAASAVFIPVAERHYSALSKSTQSRLMEYSSAIPLTPTTSLTLVQLLEALASASPDTLDSSQKVVQVALNSSSHAAEERFSFALTLLRSKHESLLPASGLDEIAEEAVHAALSGGDVAGELASLCVQSGNISQNVLDTTLALCSTTITSCTHQMLSSETTDSIAIPEPALEIFGAYAAGHLDQILRSDILRPALVDIHHIANLFPSLQLQSTMASTIWGLRSSLNPTDASLLRAEVDSALSEMLIDVECRVRPDVLVDIVLRDETCDPLSLLPPQSTIVTMLDAHLQRRPHPSLPVIDFLATYTDTVDMFTQTFDSDGRSPMGRVYAAILALFQNDRQLALQNADLLSICLLSQTLIADEAAIPSGARGIISSDASEETTLRMTSAAEGALSYVFAKVPDLAGPWHQATTAMLKTGSLSENSDSFQAVLRSLWTYWQNTRSDVVIRVFRDTLKRLLDQVGVAESEATLWLDLGMSLSLKDPELAGAIIFAAKSTLYDTKPLSVAQNRLANALTGIKATDVGQVGIPALRVLMASAPSSDIASEFLPQQRAIFVLRHISSWLVDDDMEDLPEEMEFRLAELYTILAPIVQDVEGSHWDAIFDLIESGLETSSLDDMSSWCLLHACLVLLQTVRDLASSNKSLRASWTNRDVLYKLVLDLFVQCRGDSSLPLKRIQSLLLDLIVDIDTAQSKIINSPSAPSTAQLCDLLHLSSNWAVQTMAYRLLKQVIHRDTLALVLSVEATIGEEKGVDEAEIRLPSKLVEIVNAGSSLEWHLDSAVPEVVCQILAWMAILDHFDDASRTVRSAYMDELRSTSLIEVGLLPMLFQILGVSQVGAWNFPASQFAVEEFYPELLEPEELADLTPFASHLFYRTLVTIPSVIRSVYENIKDRQLSLSLLNFVARHYSPVIIQNEFASLREPSALAQLNEEGLSVRVAQGGGSTIAAGTGSAEAIASYVVDEQPMEIGIRLPAEFPLRGVDVRDLRRVGVPENKWRGWLMSVQQTITSRNGLILEALTIFKKNVVLHFEGVVECAICYSIISLTDRTLPTKPCRTCKNRFHASCLFKWFNSSHTSSCPLCRTLF